MLVSSSSSTTVSAGVWFPLYTSCSAMPVPLLTFLATNMPFAAEQSPAHLLRARGEPSEVEERNTSSVGTPGVENRTATGPRLGLLSSTVNTAHTHTHIPRIGGHPHRKTNV